MRVYDLAQLKDISAESFGSGTARSQLSVVR